MYCWNNTIYHFVICLNFSSQYLNCSSPARVRWETCQGIFLIFISMGCSLSLGYKSGQVRVNSSFSLINDGDDDNSNSNYYPTAPHRVQIMPKTSTNITRYLYSRGLVRQGFSKRASDELDWSYEKNFCLSKRISFLHFFLTEILKWKTWTDV